MNMYVSNLGFQVTGDELKAMFGRKWTELIQMVERCLFPRPGPNPKAAVHNVTAGVVGN